MSDSRRDDFPNHFVGDLVPTEHDWVVVPDVLSGRPCLQRQGLVGQLGVVHMQWPAHGVALPLQRNPYAPQPGPHCRLRDRGPVSMWEDEQQHG